MGARCMGSIVVDNGSGVGHLGMFIVFWFLAGTLILMCVKFYISFKACEFLGV